MYRIVFAAHCAEDRFSESKCVEMFQNSSSGGTVCVALMLKMEHKFFQNSTVKVSIIGGACIYTKYPSPLLHTESIIL